MKALFSHYKKLHLWLLADLAFLAAFLLARQSRGAMNALTEGFTNPLRRAIGQFCERVPFSVAESLYVLAALGFLAFLVLGVRAVARSRHRSGTVYALVLGLGNAVLTVYVLFCLLWGANYYADSFTDKSGIDVGPVAVDDLERVTRQFAALVNEYAGDVPRAADGAFAGDRAEILAYAPKIYENLYEEFPFLEMTDVPPKAMRFSRVMSAMPSVCTAMPVRSRRICASRFFPESVPFGRSMGVVMRWLNVSRLFAVWDYPVLASYRLEGAGVGAQAVVHLRHHAF